MVTPFFSFLQKFIIINKGEFALQKFIIFEIFAIQYFYIYWRFNSISNEYYSVHINILRFKLFKTKSIAFTTLTSMIVPFVLVQISINLIVLVWYKVHTFSNWFLELFFFSFQSSYCRCLFKITGSFGLLDFQSWSPFLQSIFYVIFHFNDFGY